MKWLYNNWSKATIFLAIYMLILLLMYVKNENYALFLLWLQAPVYYLHQFEEYILPGGFSSFFNKIVLGSDQDEFPLTKKSSFWINVPLTFIAFPLSAILSQYVDMSIGIWAVYFSLCNAISHIAMFFIFRFKYNPGLIMSLLLNIPIGIYTVYYFATNHIISTPAQITGLTVGIAGQLLLMLWGFKILKPQIKELRQPY